MAIVLVMFAGVVGLIAAALWARGEPQVMQLSAAAGAAGGFVLALPIALATGKTFTQSVAVALAGAAVLALALLGQVKFMRGAAGRGQ